MEARAEARVKVAIILAPQASLQERVVETNLGNSWILFYFQATARSRGGGVCLAPDRGSKVPTAREGARATPAECGFLRVRMGWGSGEVW